MAEATHLRLALKLCCGLGVLVALAVGVDWLLRVQNYPVRNVRFEGPFRQVTQAELEAAVMPLVRGNFFLVDLEAVKQRVESISWVHRASVRRRFPDEVYVEFSEQQLFARWNDADWVNTSGEVVRVHGDGLPADAPAFAGPEGTAALALAAYRDFSHALAAQGLRIAVLRVTPRHGWRLEIERDGAGTDEGFVLMLDNDEPHRRIERFARVYAANVMNESMPLKQVDLRYTNGLSVAWRSARAGARQGSAAGAAFTAAGDTEG